MDGERGFQTDELFASVSHDYADFLPPLAQTNRSVLASVGMRFWTLLAQVKRPELSILTSFTSADRETSAGFTSRLTSMREIVYYRTWSGRSPVEFLRALQEKPRHKIVMALDLIERAETTPPGLFKKLSGTGGLWEVRVQHAGETFRLLGFLNGPRFIVLVSGFAKKTRKVPLAEISLAQERRREYERRKGHE